MDFAGTDGRKAQWLLSRDRAVLKLARRARGEELTIQTPGAWVAANVTG
jgi:hypothetical protein